MRKQQQTPVDTGTQSTDADAVQVAGKPTATRGKDATFKVNTKLTTQLITLGHYAYLALEKPEADIDLGATKRLWISNVKKLIELRVKAGADIPKIKGVDVVSYYGLHKAKPKPKLTKREVRIQRLEAELARLKAKAK